MHLFVWKFVASMTHHLHFGRIAQDRHPRYVAFTGKVLALENASLGVSYRNPVAFGVEAHRVRVYLPPLCILQDKGVTIQP